MDLNLYYVLIWIWIGIAVLVFPLATWVPAPYGRYTREGWGWFIDNKLGWMIYESPALIIVPILFFIGPAPKTLVVWVFFLGYFLHYVNRTLIFPLRIRTKGKKVPIFIVGSALFFNIVNGSILGYYLGYVQDGYAADWVSDPRFIVGLAMFLGGIFINWKSDTLLINLRKPGETGYKIPQGGFFKWVSCPNLMGEIIEWTGYAIMMWALPGVSFAIWTAANLIPRAINHHKWYKEKFSNYPKERKAVLPYLL